MPAGTSGRRPRRGREAPSRRRAPRMVAEIKEELQSEMGLLPVSAAARSALELRRALLRRQPRQDQLRHRRLSGQRLLRHREARRRRAQGRRRPAEHAQDHVDQGRLQGQGDSGAGSSTPATPTSKSTAATGRSSRRASSICRRCASTPAFAYDFAEPIFRLGNDYSKGIILSTGYVGQRTANGLVTCLTDGHPGVSGGGVLDQRGDLVGIPIGRMQGDYRFSFILPIRAEMLRKLPAYEQAEPRARRGRRRRISRRSRSQQRVRSTAASRRRRSSSPPRLRCRGTRRPSAAW